MWYRYLSHPSNWVAMTRGEALAIEQATGALADASRRSREQRSDTSMVGCLVYVMSIVAFIVGVALVIAVLTGFRRPLRELGIPTPLGTGIILITVGAFAAWSGAKVGHEEPRPRRRIPSRAGATAAAAVHVMFEGDARPPGLEDRIREHLEERFAAQDGMVVVDLYYRSEEGFLITRAELSDTEIRSLSEAAPSEEESYVESYLDRTRAHLEAIGIRALN